jgi:hypothetical protein
MWMRAALLACAMSAWLQELCGLDRGSGCGRATIARLRRELICVPARLVRHARRDTRARRLPEHHRAKAHTMERGHPTLTRGSGSELSPRS